MVRFHRRGQHEIPLHWIFALVGGTLFLLFFFILIRSVTNQNQEKNTRDLSFTVQTILTTAAATPDTFTITTLPDATYQFTCHDDPQLFEAHFQINGGSYSGEPLRYVPLFSPTFIKGDQLFTSTHTWEAPFPIGSLVLLNNNRTQYVFISSYSTSAIQSIKSLITDENLGGFSILPVSDLALNTVKDEGYDQYRVVSFDGTYHALTQLPASKITALVVSSTDDFNTGTLAFYNTTTGRQVGPTVSFIGTAMLDAAIFSQDYNTFDCNMAKARERLTTAVEVLQDRLFINLSHDPSIPLACRNIYANQVEPLFTAYQPLSNLSNMGAVIGPSGYAQRLTAVNNELIGQGCPTVY